MNSKQKDKYLTIICILLVILWSDNDGLDKTSSKLQTILPIRDSFLFLQKYIATEYYCNMAIIVIKYLYRKNNF